MIFRRYQMKEHISRVLIAAVLITTVFYFGCILDPKPDKNPPGQPQADFKPLTEPENVIFNLVLSYERADFEHYSELLHDDYIWYNQKRYANEGHEEFYTREDDERMVHHMFMAVNGQYGAPIDNLSLSIKSGTWIANHDTINGEPCEDCWETMRIYEINVTVGPKTYYGNDNIKFIVVPVMEDGIKKYKIHRAFDLEI